MKFKNGVDNRWNGRYRCKLCTHGKVCIVSVGWTGGIVQWIVKLCVSRNTFSQTTPVRFCRIVLLCTTNVKSDYSGELARQNPDSDEQTIHGDNF